MYKININILYQKYLYDAINEGDIDCIKSLLNHKKDFLDINEVYYRLQGHGTIFFAACSCGQLDILDELIELGADPNIRNIERDTPLIYAVKRDKYETVLFLLERKSVNIEITDKQGDTALTVALKLNKVEIFKALLRAGANHSMIDYNMTDFGITDITLVQYYRYLVKYSRKLFETYLSIKDNNYALEKIKDLLNSHLIINDRDLITQESLLERAIYKNNLTVASYFIKAGVGYKADIFRAVYISNIRAVKRFIQAGVDVNIIFNSNLPYGIENDNDNLLIACIRYFRPNRIESPSVLSFFKFLIEQGINVNYQNYYGKTALMYASEFIYLKLVRLLLEAGADPLVKTYEDKTALDMVPNYQGVQYLYRFEPIYKILLIRDTLKTFQ